MLLGVRWFWEGRFGRSFYIWFGWSPLGVPHIYGTLYLSLFCPSLWFLYTFFGLINLVVSKKKIDN